MTGPVTLLTLIGPWPLLLPLFCLALLIFRLETAQVTGVMTEYGHPASPDPEVQAVKQHIWLHAMALTVMVMLSSLSRPFELMTSGLFVLFIFRMSLIDTLTGWLPREFTWPFLIAGLCVAAEHHVLSSHAIMSLILLIAGLLVRKLGERFAHREVLGLGDVWLVAGLGAWFGSPLSLFSLMGGVMGFILWYAGSSTVSRGGPMGPWLGYSALLSMILSISDPILMW
ncbi:prepilin peptidase [Prodigiosinella confusarubida]|uniref:Prepilin peptidase n=1 Tax=Serratia sp. (strain ATCC 39006) TaxID=104623 RepID=A0A2I5TBF8_SERS3|nr:A24 family peptidase [Serratia sp. ATCC 39006]AUH01895.1 prepilin peptidase [Serratia sp. ATCC 39006]AUH06217.1 prepilin peptidase [Serratia sp. ATCC 39006]